MLHKRPAHLDQWSAFEVEGEPTPLLNILND
jgi:hypothetical protein